MTKRELQTRLLKAFANVKHPGNRHLHFVGKFPDGGIFEVDFLFPYEGRSWHEIDKRKLIYEEPCFTFLSDAGLLYVIPAYLYHCYNENASFDYNNGWEHRMLEVLAENGRGQLRLTPEQIHIIDCIFLPQLQREWEESGIWASGYGMNYEEMIAKVRDNYAKELEKQIGVNRCAD